MATFPRRTFLSRRGGLSSFDTVYRTRDAIEVDELEGTDVSRRRVLFDEVLFVTLHQEFGWAFVVMILVILTITVPISLLAALADGTTGAILAFFTVLPFVALLVLRFAMRVDVVTVQGPRSRVQIPFWFRKARAREVFGIVTRMAREHQARRAKAQGVAPTPEPPPRPEGAPPESVG